MDAADVGKPQEKKRHPLRNVLFLLCGLLLPVLVFGYALREHAWYGYLSAKKLSAKTVYQLFCAGGIADLAKQAEIPAHETLYVTGYYRDAAWYCTDTDVLLPANTALYGEPEGSTRSFFALKCQNGQVTEAWVSNYPLYEEAPVPVTTQEQQHPVPLFTPFGDAQAMGYYHPD